MKIVHMGLSFISLFESPNSEICSLSYNQNMITVYVTVHAADSVLADLSIQLRSAI